MLALTLALHGLPSSPTPPTLPQDFYVGSQDNLAIVQGGYFVSGGGCCSASHSSQCKIQAISSGSDVYQQGSMKRVRSDSAQGSIVTDYIAKKQMLIVPVGTPGTPKQNSTHKYVCAAYCPTQHDDFESMVRIGDGQKGFLDKPRDRGTVQVTQPSSIGGNSKSCEEWSWDETILGLIPMSKNALYVTKEATPAPFFSSMEITPFGAKPLGAENVSFVQFTPRTFGGASDSTFDIDPDTVKHCQINPRGCGDDNKKQKLSSDADKAKAALAMLHERSLALQQLRFTATSMTQKAEAQAAEAHSLRAGAVGGASEAILVEQAAHGDGKDDPPKHPKIDWAKDFTALEDATMTINQGGTVKSGGDICCDGSHAGQCQIQYVHQHGDRYYDQTNKRERFEDAVANQVIVTDYAKHMDMLINTTDGSCQEYCPLDPRDTMDGFDPFDPFDAVVDKGEVKFEGKKAHKCEAGRDHPSHPCNHHLPRMHAHACTHAPNVLLYLVMISRVHACMQTWQVRVEG